MISGHAVNASRRALLQRPESKSPRKSNPLPNQTFVTLDNPTLTTFDLPTFITFDTLIPESRTIGALHGQC